MPTEVVTVFLRHEGLIMLVRRSDRVGTYQGRHAGISGYLEGDPAEHFRVEIEEETGLTPYEYRLLRRGEPLAVRDEEQNRDWLVHPFLCEVADPERITLDWENVSLEWIDPADIAQYETVPRLAETYELVCEHWLDELIAGQREALARDVTGGARQLAVRALQAVGVAAERSNAATDEVLLADVLRMAAALKGVRPSMAVIDTALELLRHDVAGLDGELRWELAALVGRHVRELERAVGQACRQLPAVVPRGARVLAHSYSSSLEAAFTVLAGLGCALVVCEARPGCEGRRTAACAAAAGLPVTLITEAQAAHMMPDVDVVLLGADGIEVDGSVVNKAGSCVLALTAQHYDVPVYVLAERRKISLRPEPLVLEEHPPEEVLPESLPGVRVKNVWFDRTPPKFVKGIILEDAVVEPYQVGRIAGMLRGGGPG